MARLSGLIKANMATPAPQDSAVSIRKKLSWDIFSHSVPIEPQR